MINLDFGRPNDNVSNILLDLSFMIDSNICTLRPNQYKHRINLQSHMTFTFTHSCEKLPGFKSIYNHRHNIDQ